MKKEGSRMPTICILNGVKIYMNYNEHLPPHFHAQYGEYTCAITIEGVQILAGTMPTKQLKMIIKWANFYQQELKREWKLAEEQKELFPINPL